MEIDTAKKLVTFFCRLLSICIVLSCFAIYYWLGDSIEMKKPLPTIIWFVWFGVAIFSISQISGSGNSTIVNRFFLTLWICEKYRKHFEKIDNDNQDLTDWYLERNSTALVPPPDCGDGLHEIRMQRIHQFNNDCQQLLLYRNYKRLHYWKDNWMSFVLVVVISISIPIYSYMHFCHQKAEKLKKLQTCFLSEKDLVDIDDDIVYVCYDGCTKTYHTSNKCGKLQSCKHRLARVIEEDVWEFDYVECPLCKK